MTSHKISKKTLFWVCAAHVLILLLAVFLSHVLAPTPPPKMLEMIGLPENLNPAEGTPSSQSRGPANPNPAPQQSAPPAPAPPQPSPPTPQPTPPAPQPTPPQPVPPQPRVTEPTPPTPVVKNDFPTEPPPKPVKPKVKVNLTETVRNNSNNNTSTVKPSFTSTQRSTSTSGGVSASSVEQSLNRAMGGGDPNAGVSGGSRNGTDSSPGSRTGNANGDWYRTLIKNTLERHWMKPQSDNPNLTTTIRIRVLADGTIEYLGMTNGSGDAAMDNSVVSAVRAAGKVSIPPPEGFPKPYEDTVIFRLKGDM